MLIQGFPAVLRTQLRGCGLRDLNVTKQSKQTTFLNEEPFETISVSENHWYNLPHVQMQHEIIGQQCSSLVHVLKALKNPQG